MNDVFWAKKLRLMKMCELSLRLRADERIIFVADVHLSSTNENKNRIFVNFLKTLDSNVKAVFIIGDLFNFYVGKPQGDEKIYKSVFEETKRLQKNGTKLFFLPGNRDFFAFDELQKYGIMNLPQWAKITVENDNKTQKILMTHGDNLIVNKHLYRIYTKIIRSGVVYSVYNTISYKHRRNIAKFLRKSLSAKYKPKFSLEECSFDFDFVDKDTVEAFKFPIESGLTNTLILGHWHLRANIELNPGKIFVVGDWRENEGAFVEFKNGSFNHEIFAEKN